MIILFGERKKVVLFLKLFYLLLNFHYLSLYAIALFLPGDKDVVKYRYCVFSGGKFNRWEYQIHDGTSSSTTIIIERTLDTSKYDYTVMTTSDSYGYVNVQDNLITTMTSQTVITKNVDGHTQKAKLLNDWSKRSQVDNTIKPSDGVIIVSYFLPVILSKVDGNWAARWDEENILSFNLPMRATWIGSVRYNNAPIPLEDEENVTRALLKLNCNPIFINQSVHHQFYDIFCKQNLWLLMHLVSDVYGPVEMSDIGAKSQQDLWYTYITVNNIFRDKLIEVFSAKDMIWIHGFHLMLLPSFIRRRLQSVKIGYFFHTPFPSSEIWRTITRRDDLLRGILAADQIGFHLFEYARHFLSCCHRLLGYSYDTNASGMISVNIDGREVAISCIHIGVDLQHVNRELNDITFTNEVNSWIEKTSPDKIIVAGIDRLERLKGIPLKLNAIDQFLDENRHYVGKITFFLVGISAFERGNDYLRTVRDIHTIVDRLNQKYKITDDAKDFLIYFEERTESNLTLRNRLALFAASDILMITPPRYFISIIALFSIVVSNLHVNSETV